MFRPTGFLRRGLTSASTFHSIQKNTLVASIVSSRSITTETKGWTEELNKRLQDTDPELYGYIEDEKIRQKESLVLIASENFTSKSVFDALGSVMSNKYSEGYPYKRYYGGNENIDKVESLCQSRALEAFNVSEKDWGVNVQTLSGSPANFQAYTAVLEPHARIMALDLPHGGHLSHGYQTPTKKISMVSKYFETFPYRLNESTGLIDYDKMDEYAELFRPKLIVAGTSAYSRTLDYKRMREIADKHNAYLLADMAHISGLVSAQVIPSPFEYADIVTTTTHKSLRGPRGAMIFYRKGVRSTDKKTGKEIMYDLDEKINFAVFPGLQGGPHNHTIAALATALKQAKSQDYIKYQHQVVANSKALADALVSKGYSLVSGGTDNHLVLIDLKPKGIDGARVEKIMEMANIACNKNTVPGDKSALTPGGIRLGAPALTTRGFTEEDFVKVAEFTDRSVQIAIDIKNETGPKMKDFRDALANGPGKYTAITDLKNDVKKFASSFPTIGF